MRGTGVKINTDSLPTDYVPINIANEAHCVHCEIQIQMHHAIYYRTDKGAKPGTLQTTQCSSSFGGEHWREKYFITVVLVFKMLLFFRFYFFFLNCECDMKSFVRMSVKGKPQMVREKQAAMKSFEVLSYSFSVG